MAAKASGLLLTILFQSVIASFNLEDKYVDMTYSFDEVTLGWVTERPYEIIFKYNKDFRVQTEELCTSTHIGTHMAAPCHVAKGRWTIDQIPLSHLFGDAAVVDITEKVLCNSNANAEIEDFKKWEWRTGQKLNDKIVILKTGWGKRWPDPVAYIGNDKGNISDIRVPGISVSAAKWLVKRKIKGLGVESLSLDNGLTLGKKCMASHRSVLYANMYVIENVANLHRLPPHGAKLYIAPMKLKNACGASVRIIATLPGWQRHWNFF